MLVNKEHGEISELPEQASEEMKLWFTGHCLNAVPCVDYLCSEAFASRLGQFGTTQEKELCVIGGRKRAASAGVDAVQPVRSLLLAD